VTTADPQQFIKEHILRGDRGDGIPNFLSPDNTFALGERQKVISKKKLVEWVNSDPKEFCITDTMMRGYKRNQLLVDLDCVPENIKENIVKVFEETKPGTKQKMLNYFIQNRMKYLIEVIDEF
jgi:hypothetical protein